MKSAPLVDNPFTVQSPEDIAAAEVVDLFVDVFTDFYNVPNPGHTFVHGPRGSGKTMMFRYLEPDCQRIAHQNVSLREIPFYAVYVPIKNTDLKLTEFERLENKQANSLLNEHFLTVFIAARVFKSLLERSGIINGTSATVDDLRQYWNEPLRKLLQKAGAGKILKPLSTQSSIADYLTSFVDLFDQLHSGVTEYLKRLSFRRKSLTYDGPLCGYLDFLLPMLKELRALGFMPRGPIYLLLDDADNLNEPQTRILNSWVFSRTSSDVSLKISTQLNYKTYRTVTDQRIDSPHDYTEINISTVYASAKSQYFKRVEEIVQRRLRRHGIQKSPAEFFPVYAKQEAEVNRIAEEYKTRWNRTGRGHRARDDAYRYARPDFIASLSGQKKASSKYRYAGFGQLVYVSSGVVRYFLEAASRMYVETISSLHGKPVTCIGSLVQDKITREEAERFMFAEFDKLSREEEGQAGQATSFIRLKNLIQALGGAFHEILLSKKSERRVFSVAFSDSPDPEVLAVFRLGVQCGYFHEASIGNKEGSGRTRMFVLSRRLAPFFNLDPTGFAGYKFVTNNAIREAILRPKAFVANIENGKLLEDPQIALFGEGLQ